MVGQLSDTISYREARRTFQQVYGEQPVCDRRLDRVVSHVGRGKKFERFMRWGRVPDEFLPVVVGLVPRLGFDLVDLAVGAQRESDRELLPDDWSAICGLHSLASERVVNVDTIRARLTACCLPARYRVAYAVAEGLKTIENRAGAFALSPQTAAILGERAAEIGLRPIDFLGLLRTTYHFELAGQMSAFEGVALRVVQDGEANVGLHPLVRVLFQTTWSRWLLRELGEKWRTVQELEEKWRYLPFLDPLRPGAEKMYVMALLDQIPPQYHARFARLFNGLGISHLLSDIERAVEVVAGLREEEGRAAAWGAVDLLSLRAGHWRDLPQLLRDGYFREYLLGDTFYAVPLRCDQWETIMVLRLQEAEVPLLERYGYLTGRWFFSHEEALLDSAKDIFATMLFSRYPLGQAALDELQSNVWHHLPAILRERYANWDQLIAGLGITFARQQGCTRMTMPAASCKVKVSYPLALAVRNYDDPARALGFNPSPNGEYWVLDMV